VAASSTPGISPVSLHICPCTHSPSAQSSPPSETGQQQLDLSSVIRKQQLCHHPSGSSLVLPPARRSPTRCLRMGITSCHMFDKASPLSTTPLGAGPKNASEKPWQLHYVAAGPTRLLKDIVHWSSVTVCPLSGNVIRIIKSSCKLKPPLFLTECNIMVEYLLHWWNK